MNANLVISRPTLFSPTNIPVAHDVVITTWGNAACLGYVLRASDQRARSFPRSTHLSGQTHVCRLSCPAWKRLASERAKRTLWLVTATKLVCPLLPGRSCWGAAVTSHDGISGKKDAITDTLQLVEEQFASSVNKLRTGLLNCLNARSRGLNFRHRASCI